MSCCRDYSDYSDAQREKLRQLQKHQLFGVLLFGGHDLINVIHMIQVSDDSWD